MSDKASSSLTRLKRPHIVVVGSINRDLVLRLERLPGPGETVTGSSLQTFNGGKGANQAVAAARLGAQVSLIGRVGADAPGAELRRALVAAGVDDTAVLATDESSGTAVVATDRHGENLIMVAPGANGRLTPADIDASAQLIGSATLVLAQLEVPLATVERTAEICEGAGVPLMLDPAPAAALPAALLKRVTWLTPNETEAATLLGLSCLDMESKQIVTRLLELGTRNVVLKRGSRGVTLGGADAAPSNIAAPSVHAVDTTAAGDAFNGAFAFALALGRPLHEAARFANAAAALSVTRAGAQASMPTLEEVEALTMRPPARGQ